MPAPANLPEFLDLVRKSGLIDPGRLEEVIARYRSANTLPQSIDTTAQMLVREGLLSFFQAKQLKLGRYKRFTIGSKYRLLELLGSGGMGAVYLCEHTLMKRLVALKVLPTEKLEDPSSLDRFYREARAVAALNHPNIVRAHDIDAYDKLHFLVMEFVDGASLQEIIARHGVMDPVRAAHYIAQAAVGLQHAHELGMVHRDIKPGNLLLDRTGIIKILDMGLARFFNKSVDNVTEKYDDKCVLGTADYLAPEQAVSSNVDVRADIYSLGGTLYFMLTGQTPYPDGTIASKLVAHQTREPKPVDAFRKDVPAGVLEVLRKMMAKEPDDRYQTPVEVAVALAEWGEAPLGPPPAKEMPALCPLVLGLTGHQEKVGSAQTPLSRVLFGPGQGVFATASAPGSGKKGLGAKHQGSGPYSGSKGSAAVPVGSDRARASLETPPLAGPKSTERASAVPTAALPVRRAKSDKVDANPSIPSDKTPSGTSPAPKAPPGINLSPRLQLALLIALGLSIFLVGGLAFYLIMNA